LFAVVAAVNGTTAVYIGFAVRRLTVVSIKKYCPYHYRKKAGNLEY